MPDFPEHLIVQAILAAQARFEDAEKVAAEAAKAYVAGLTAFKAVTSAAPERDLAEER